ncbi:MAG: outer membrane lipoprotein-sorting protein [Acidobacteria bacterium]|nr:MAG: outer membrane lipoprotein-sorting protein [Acidobacteriota bacterium]
MMGRIMRIWRLSILLILLGIVTGPLFPQTSQQRAKEIIDRVDRMLRGDSSVGRVEMTVATRQWKRTTELRIWSEGTDKVLVRIEAPKKDQGTSTLRVGDNIWNYLPKIDRVIRVPTSMMMASWMGSHFTNDDLVQESRLARDYDITIEFEGARNGVEVYEFLLMPRPQAPVVWGKIVYQIRKSDLMPVWARFYGEDGELKRRATFSDYQTMDGRLVPALMRMTPQDKPGEYTEMKYRELEFDVKISESIFSLKSLRGS